ncbi:MAG: CoA transferase [Betaproteobacteria bacterium]|nr:CoA transferase [Betaproteobacteria bacterium]
MRQPLDGVEILECGDRIAVSACGSVLLALGARVSVLASDEAAARLPELQRAGKQRLNADDGALRAEFARAHIVITSSDVTRIPRFERAPSQIVCDITAYGASGPLAGVAHSDALVQATSGLADTTGEPDGPPALCPFPQTEGIAALYATAGILAAWHVRSRTGLGQAIEIALFDCAFSTLSTFLPFHFVGKAVTRSGNRHVLASPWNAFRAGDGWLLICTGADDQWKRLCEVIERPDLARDPRLAKAADRVQQRPLVDGAVQAWISRLRAADAAAALQTRGIAAGPVVPMTSLQHEPNIAHRGLYTASGMRSAIRYFGGRTGPASPLAPRKTHAEAGAAPLAGLKVLEIGQYTTAPLVARNLGALGAEVLKIEPPGGDAARGWPPQQDDQGYFFTLSNSDKRSVCLDLRDPGNRKHFASLLRGADVLVENLKPGSLDKLGFDAAERARINPALVYCAISGFGAGSAYPGRPAFDTVIQAMSGIMDAIRVNGVPQKTGISFADILGGLFALIATLSALVARNMSGAGDAIDISMQDAAAWITQWQRAGVDATRGARVVRCADGYVAVDDGHGVAVPASDAAGMTRSALVERLTRQNVAAVAVRTVAEVAESEQVRSRNLLLRAHDSAGREWAIFTCPIRLAVTPARARMAIGPLGEANAALALTRPEKFDRT